jgi:hypothetical protein
VAEILEVLEGRVLASLNRVMVFWTTIWRSVQPLKWQARLLCDYVRVEDPTREVVEELESDAVVEWVARLVGIGVATENVIVAFSVSHRPNLMSFTFQCLSSYPKLASVLTWLVLAACSIVGSRIHIPRPEGAECAALE